MIQVEIFDATKKWQNELHANYFLVNSIAAWCLAFFLLQCD